jgi:hypothetical protein
VLSILPIVVGHGDKLLGDALSLDIGPNVRFVLLTILGLVNAGLLTKNTVLTRKAAEQVTPTDGTAQRQQVTGKSAVDMLVGSLDDLRHAMDELSLRVAQLEAPTQQPPQQLPQPPGGS